jgi:site-specific DNA-methyltransferase (adenine-specific)
MKRKLSPAVTAVLAGEQSWTVEHTDCLALLRSLPDASVDSIVTDPPSGIGFMGKAWDSNKGGRKKWIAWLAKIMKEALRVLKPGGHALVWALPRTSHWTATALEDAGFEIRDVLTHLFGQGMPKNQDASKAIDIKNGDKAKRPVVGSYMAGGNAGTSTSEKSGTYAVGAKNSAPVELTRTIGATEQSRAWDGWGTALRPAAENWILARKPLIGILADNLIEHGTGAINIDANRIPRNYDAEPDRPESWRKSGHSAKPDAEKIAAPPGIGIDLHPGGGWPANAIFSHDADCGEECAAGCPVALLEADSEITTSSGTEVPGDASPNGIYSRRQKQGRGQIGHGDTGTSSRFFNILRVDYEIDTDPFYYQAKPATSERELGCDAFKLKTASELVEREVGSVGINNGRAGAGRSSDGRRNNHPTLKSIALMRLLTRAITRKGGVCLDLFTGSGTTGMACLIEGFRFIGAELNDTPEEPFASIARARITHVAGGVYLPREELRAEKLPTQKNLFEVSA